jgi:hypothetical protein
MVAGDAAAGASAPHRLAPGITAALMRCEGVSDLSLATRRLRSSTNGRPTSNAGRESDYLRVPGAAKLAGTVGVADASSDMHTNGRTVDG